MIQRGESLQHQVLYDQGVLIEHNFGIALRRLITTKASFHDLTFRHDLTTCLAILLAACSTFQFTIIRFGVLLGGLIVVKTHMASAMMVIIINTYQTCSISNLMSVQTRVQVGKTSLRVAVSCISMTTQITNRTTMMDQLSTLRLGKDAMVYTSTSTALSFQ